MKLLTKDTTTRKLTLELTYREFALISAGFSMAGFMGLNEAMGMEPEAEGLTRPLHDIIDDLDLKKSEKISMPAEA